MSAKNSLTGHIQLRPMRRAALAVIAIFGTLSGCVSVTAEPASFGQVQFQNSCQPSVQIKFERAVALLHSFEFGEAEQEFRQVERADTTCMIAAWGCTRKYPTIGG